MRPVCGGRRWVSTCLGPWRHSVCFGPRGSCERCFAVAWKSKARERVQEAAELRLHGEMKSEWQRWQDSWGVRAEGGEDGDGIPRMVHFKSPEDEGGDNGAGWRRRWRRGLEERVARRAAGCRLAARVARAGARAWYAGYYRARAACVSIQSVQ